MKKLFLIFIFLNILNFSKEIREYKNVYKYELSDNYEENEIKEIYYYGNKYHSSLSLRSTLNTIGLNYNLSDPKTLEKYNLDFQFQNPSKKLKIDFDRNKENNLVAKIYSMSDYSETINIKYDKINENNFNNNSKLSIGYTNYNTFGRDRIFNINYTFNPKNFLNYSKINASYLFLNYENLYKTKYELEFLYSKNKYFNYINAGIRTNFKGNVLKNSDKLIFELDTKYDFIQYENNDEILFKNRITLPFLFEYKYKLSNTILKYKIKPEFQLYIYPDMIFNFNVLNSFGFEYYNNKYSLNTEIILYNLIKKSEIDIMEENKVNDRSYICLKNDLIYNFGNDLSTTLYGNIYMYKNNDKKINSEIGIIFDYKNNKNFDINTKLGFIYDEILKLNLGFDMKIKIK